ncbi:MAG: hypothetical protein WAT67_01025 [Candidatus Contendobacter sp.]
MNMVSLVIIALWVIASALILIFAGLGVDTTLRFYYSNSLQILSPILSAFFCYQAAASFPTGNPMRKVWKLIGTGILAWGIGAILYVSYPLLHHGAETPYPYYSDAAYLCLVPLVVTGLFLFKKSVGIVSPLWGKIVAILLFMAGLYISTIANWEGIFKEEIIVRLVSASYMLFDPFLLMVVLLVASGLQGGATAEAWWYVLAGLVLYFIGDQAYTYLVFTEQYTSGSPIDIFWVLGFGIIAVAAMMTRSLFKGAG